MSSGQVSTPGDSGIVAIIRDVTPDRVVPVADAIAEGGADAIEITANSTGFRRSLRKVNDHFATRDVVVGAGTVLDSETAVTALRAGAEFVVTTTFDKSVIDVCNRYGVLVSPGVATLTEALRAYEAGADSCKVFPASVLGPEHISALRGLLNQIPLLLTGGVSAANAAAFFTAGATALGVGSAIVDGDAVKQGAYQELTDNACRLVDTAARHRDVTR